MSLERSSEALNSPYLADIVAREMWLFRGYTFFSISLFFFSFHLNYIYVESREGVVTIADV